MALVPLYHFNNLVAKLFNSRSFCIHHPTNTVKDRTNHDDTKTSGDDNGFRVSIDVYHFAPDEINVKVVNGFVVIEGKHEEKCDEHGYISRQFVRRFKLPQGCLPDTIKSKLSSDGVLTVTAPKVLPLPSIGERIVPIVYTK